jgi:hypothetical protein
MEAKQIASLKKQNEGMETSFQTKGIKFTKLSIDSMDPEAELLLLKDYNNYLKGISAANRPPPQVKEEKPKVAEVKPKEEEDDDEPIKEVKPVFSTITNMEDIKRAFFSKDYDTAYQLIRQHPFKFYKANYKYADDNAGRPAFVAKNLLRGFVQSLDDYRKYLMVGFRCISNVENSYSYPSYWIVNSNDDLKTILGSIYDDFVFIPVVEEERIVRMYRNMQKNEDETDEALIGEVYLH